MPELLQPLPQQSHSQDYREDALRRLSRSPHPYHRQHFQLPHASEKFTSRNAPPLKSPLRSAQVTDDEQDRPRPSEGLREPTNSDSGTEADDEHFLKGLPAPKLRPHKGLRVVDRSASGSPSPLTSPAIFDEEFSRTRGFLRRTTIPTSVENEDDLRKFADTFREKRRIEVIRRLAESGIVLLLACILCIDIEIRALLKTWKKELACQLLVTISLIAVYPLRVLRHSNPLKPWKMPLQIGLPASFDPAPLLYPPTITMLVASVLSRKNTLGFLPSIILGISSLPLNLIPSTGGAGGAYITQWLLSCTPLLVNGAGSSTSSIVGVDIQSTSLNREILVLLCPLHLALCTTLHYLTTTSLLPAELQLLSASLIELLLLAASPQAIILKALLWGGGIGMLVSCGHVLRWGVALARVPKWRFRRPGNTTTPTHGKGVKFMRKAFSFGMLGKSIFAKDIFNSGSSSDEELFEGRADATILKLNTHSSNFSDDNSFPPGSTSAVEPKSPPKFSNGSTKSSDDHSLNLNKRHTLPLFTNLPSRSGKRTPSGRRKRATSSSVQAFFALTQGQAAVRKWLYAAYVYFCVLAIILVGIREYVGRFALHGNEPVGWALGYLFGDLPWFRMEVITANLQRWICLPPRSNSLHKESCHMGWVQHLRHASFGEANTRLILSAYWLAIIVVGLAIVFRLSSIYEVDTRRKVFHFMMVAMLLPSTFIDPTYAALALILMLAIFLLLDLFRASQLPPVSKHLAYFLTPYVDGRDLKGPVVISHIFLLIGCAIPLWLSLASLPRIGNGHLDGWEVPTREVSMVSGVICVGMGDAAASLIGRRYGRRKWVWGGGKSIEGSVAFATAVGLALILAKAWLRIGGWPANNDDSWFMTFGKAGVAAWVGSLTEAVLTGGNDNVVVPVVLWLCVKGLDI